MLTHCRRLTCYVFTSTDGQTGSVDVKLQASFCPLDVEVDCTPGEPGADCTPGWVHVFQGDDVGGSSLDLFYFRYFGSESIPLGCSPPCPEVPEPYCEVPTNWVTVDLDETYSWGPTMFAQLRVEGRGSEYDEYARLHARLTLGGLPGRRSTDGLFILPPGITVNAPSIGLVDNHFETEACFDDLECGDGDGCTVDACDPGNPEAGSDGCVHEFAQRLFGDIVPVFCPPDCSQPDVDDIICVLDDFGNGSGVDGCSGSVYSTDLAPCGGNELLDLEDILYVLDAFAQIYACPHPCP